MLVGGWVVKSSQVRSSQRLFYFNVFLYTGSLELSHY